ncbi:MAG: transglutaminase family protein [Spirochaetales bacterium]|nr:transglutaminase family protein [Spirochaetales bacterium]
MKNLHFDYSFEIGYSSDVCTCYYTIKCIPQDSARQKIKDIQIEMIPESKPEYSYDCHGNRYIWGCNAVPHKRFLFRITGTAICGLSDYEEVVEGKELMIFRHPSKLNLPGEKIKAYHAECEKVLGLKEMKAPFEKAKALAGKLHSDFIYEKNVTDVGTLAEEAFSNGKGVCQDFAHILISLLHLSGCSARYVTGFITGEGATHAWVEVASDGKWYGIDPCNNMLVEDTYIKVGVGRDASECLINRGIMHGGGDQTLDTHLIVQDVGNGSSYLRKGLV